MSSGRERGQTRPHPATKGEGVGRGHSDLKASDHTSTSNNENYSSKGKDKAIDQDHSSNAQPSDARPSPAFTSTPYSTTQNRQELSDDQLIEVAQQSLDVLQQAQSENANPFPAATTLLERQIAAAQAANATPLMQWKNNSIRKDFVDQCNGVPAGLVDWAFQGDENAIDFEGNKVEEGEMDVDRL